MSVKWEHCCSWDTREEAERVVGRGQRRLNQTDLKRQAGIHKKRRVFQVEGTAQSDMGLNQNDLFSKDLQNGDYSLKT